MPDPRRRREEKKTMKTLLEFREKIKKFFAKYDIYLIPVLKFLLALVTFIVINTRFGYMESLASPSIAVLLSLICALLPVNATVVLAALMLLIHAYALSVEVCIFTLAVMLIMLLLFFRMAPQYGYVLLLTPLAHICGIPYLVPLVMGLIAAPVAAVPVACGTFMYYLLHYVNQNTAILGGALDTDTMAEKFMALIDNAVGNKEMILMIIAFTLTLLAVYAVRHMSFDYSLSVSVGVGMVLELVVLLVGTLVMDVSLKIVWVVLGCIISGILAFALQITVFSLDYSRTEYVQFEDDDYLYYVKAVPKITISVSDKKVKKIATRKKPAASKKAAVKKTSGQAQHRRNTDV